LTTSIRSHFIESNIDFETFFGVNDFAVSREGLACIGEEIYTFGKDRSQDKALQHIKLKNGIVIGGKKRIHQVKAILSLL